MIRSGTGNLLGANVDALVNTVNCVGVMGKGIALQFKKAWPAMFKDYKSACTRKEVQPGHIHVWHTQLLTGPRFILNFPTKRHWRAKSRMEDIDAGLVDLVRRLGELEVSSIAIPPLGAGNGGLDWKHVRPRIIAALESLDDIDVHLWEPGHAPAPRAQIINTPRPHWTSTRAAMVALMSQYRVLDDDLTQLEVQKLGYFLQKAGYEMRLIFTSKRYGPYADGLFHALMHLEGHFIRGLVDRDPRALIEPIAEAVSEAKAFVEKDASFKISFERVSKLIEGFETPYGLEILASLHWLSQADRAVGQRSDIALERLQGWNTRKRDLMEPRHVHIAWQRLHDHGWFEDSPRC